MANFNEEVFFSTVADLNRRLVAREFTAVELARAFAERLEAAGASLNALALSLRAKGIEKAKSVDDELKRNRLRGPLQGVPFGLKDLVSVANHPTTWGAKPYAAQVFDYDATIVKRLDKAGAVLIGKLAMIELAGGGGYRYANASLTGATLNPWDRTRWAGGSSSGSAAAVAAGLVPFAIGSETWGSILNPCASCGVTGLRPTYGYVSRAGAMALSWTMDKLGPICRSAEDCGRILQVISGGDSNDPSSAGKSFYYGPQYVRSFQDLKLGFASVDFDAWPEEACRKPLRGALDVLRTILPAAAETRLPDFPYSAVAGTIITAEGSAVFEPLITSGKIEELADKRQIASLKAGLEIPAKDYLKAMRIRSLIQRSMRKLFTEVDVLVSPSLFRAAPKLSEPLDSRRDQSARPKDRGLFDLGAAGNLAGLPALSLPCGFAGNMPVAIQLVGRPFSENTLLAVGAEFQRRTDWHKRRPGS
jgi:aspartyl-tRNA(Asn)/glutamyl-tRNA(Gln) amidotransferase subunit A